MKKRREGTQSQKNRKAGIILRPPKAAPKSKVRQPAPAGVTRVIAKMRSDGISLRKAAREAKVAPRTVLKRGASALRKTKSGRYAARSSDRLIRQVKIPTPNGLLEIEVRGLREASKLARYWNFLDRYYQTGDKEVQKFAGQFVTDINGVKHPLLTDLNVLNRLGSAGVLSFESLYGRSE